MGEISPQKYVWIDGRLIRWEDAKIHVVSNSLHYGLGVFEGIRAYKTRKGTAIFRLEEHIIRFLNSGKVYRMNIRFTVEELIEACKETVRVNRLEEAYIRPIAIKDCSDMSLNVRNYPSKVIIVAWPWGTYLGRAYEEGCKCMVSTWRRMPPSCLPTAAKACGQYINSQLARMEAAENGYDEAIMLDHRGFISEGTGENIFIVKDEAFYTPPEYASILVGITRNTVMELLKDQGYRVEEKDLTLSDLFNADEAFFTGTAAEVTPIVNVNGINIGNGKPGKLTRFIQKLYAKVVRGEIEEYEHWLTYV